MHIFVNIKKWREIPRQIREGEGGNAMGYRNPSNRALFTSSFVVGR